MRYFRSKARDYCGHEIDKERLILDPTREKKKRTSTKSIENKINEHRIYQWRSQKFMETKKYSSKRQKPGIMKTLPLKKTVYLLM